MKTVKEAAVECNVSVQAIHLAIKDGRLKSELRYGRTVIRDKDVAAYKETVGKRNGSPKHKKKAAE